MLNSKLSAVVAAALSTLVAVPAFASEFEFNQSVDGLFIQSVELIDQGHYTEAKVLFNAGSCDAAHYLNSSITVSGYEDRGYGFSGTANVNPVEGTSHQYATVYIEGYNIESADNLNIRVVSDCFLYQYDFEPEILEEEVENLGDSIAEETERVGDNVKSGVEQLGNGIADIFGW